MKTNSENKSLGLPNGKTNLVERNALPEQGNTRTDESRTNREQKKIHLEKKRRLAMKIAYLYSEGIPPKRLAEVFGLTPTRVSHLLDDARRLGFLAGAPKFFNGVCTLEERNDLDQCQLGYRLQVALRDLNRKEPVTNKDHGPLRDVSVVPTGNWGTSIYCLEQRMEFFSECIAPKLRSLIAGSRMIGVMWGMTIAKAVSALEELDLAEFQNAHRQFVALCGEPFSQENHRSSSSRIVEELDRMQGGAGKSIYTMRGIPAFIPSEFALHRKVILEFFQKHTVYGRIFGPPTIGNEKPIVAQLDMVLTGVGNFKTPLGSFVPELAKMAGVGGNKEQVEAFAAHLETLAYGDIGGALLGRETSAPAAPSEFQKIADTWIGISPSDLCSVAERSWIEGGPGVVVLAIGDCKAEVIIASVKQHLVNELFLDQSLALALAAALHLDLKRDLSKL